MGGLIVVMVLTAILLKLILVGRKKDKPVQTSVLQTQNSEASLRYTVTVATMLIYVMHIASYVYIAIDTLNFK